MNIQVLEERLKATSYKLDKQVHENATLAYQLSQAKEKQIALELDLA